MDRFAERSRRILAVALLVAALLIGGGGGPLLDLIVELLGVALLAATLCARGAGVPPGARAAIAVVVAIAALPLVQLVPLPPVVWRSLPGRELAVLARDALGAGQAWFPFSLDPEATRRSALYLIPALALFLSTLRAGARERRRLIAVTLAGIFVGMIAGVLQVTLGTAFYPYATAHYGNAVGLLVNRNHEATLLLIGVALLPTLVVGDDVGRTAAAAPRGGFGGRAGVWLVGGVMMLFALAVIITISRAGLLAMPLVLVAALACVVPRRPGRLSLRAGAAGALAVAALLALLATNTVTQHAIARFAAASQDGRPSFWIDTMTAIRAFWPAGSGIGTFVPVYASFESLDHVLPRYVNHAHNEYLELTLEAGAAAIAVILAYLAAIGVALRRPLAGAQRQQRRCALIGIVVVLAHATVDYPLRILTLITVFGLLHALLFAAPRRTGAGAPADRMEPPR